MTFSGGISQAGKLHIVYDLRIEEFNLELQIPLFRFVPPFGHNVLYSLHRL